MIILPHTSGIYQIICTTTGKCYIGSTGHLRNRQKAHLSNLRLNKHTNPKLQAAWNKYGEEAFTFEVLEFVLPIGLTDREQYWFNKLQPFGTRGFNISTISGTRRGVKDSPEAREKKRLARIGRKPALGFKHTEETKAKMSRDRAGRKLSEQACKNISLSRMGNKSKLGQKLSPITIEKLRQAKLGKKRKRP